MDTVATVWQRCGSGDGATVNRVSGPRRPPLLSSNCSKTIDSYNIMRDIKLVSAAHLAGAESLRPTKRTPRSSTPLFDR